MRRNVVEFPIQGSEVVFITSPGLPEGSKHSDNPKECVTMVYDPQIDKPKPSALIWQ
jgi:hypothetical protein